MLGTIARGAARGAIAAMAMSGLRRVTTSLGLVEVTPPESMLAEGAPVLFHRIPPRRRPVLVETAHWSYGAVGGALFGMLPGRVRRHPLTGLVYGVVVWTAFEAGIAPALGLVLHRDAPVVGRLAVLADHLLYGVVVAASPWPHGEPQ